MEHAMRPPHEEWFEQSPSPFDPWAVDAPPLSAEYVACSSPPDPTALLPWIDDLLAFGEVQATQREQGPTRHAKPTRVAKSEVPQSSNRLPHQNWDAMTRATIPEHWAPAAVDLPMAVVAGLDDAWQRTARDGNEHGGNVLRAKGMRADTHTKYTSAGGSHHFDPDLTQTDGMTFVGTYHSHPLNDGAGDDAFSETDVSNMLDPGKRVSLMRSGDSTRMLARTKQFEALMKDANLDDLGNEMDAAYNAVYREVLGDDPKKHVEAMEAATRATAEKYHLLYYAGKGKQLRRVGGKTREQ